jgi:hypothetical protein
VTGASATLVGLRRALRPVSEHFQHCCVERGSIRLGTSTSSPPVSNTSVDHPPAREGVRSRTDRELLRPLLLRLHKISSPGAQAELKRRKGDQVHAFEQLKEQFSPVYSSIRRTVVEDQVAPIWGAIIGRLERDLLPFPPVAFLSVPDVLTTVVSIRPNAWNRDDLVFLRQRLAPEVVRHLLEEDYVGVPLVIDRSLCASNETIRHLYQFCWYSEHAGVPLDGVRRVLEWGGGYGSQARMFARLAASPSVTYVIVDLPIMSALQWLFLGSVLGKERIHVLTSATSTIKEGRINLVPSGLSPQLSFKPDLFVSTWALGEAAPSAWAMTQERGWSSAPHVLMTGAKHRLESPFSPGFRQWALGQGLSEVEGDMHGRGMYYWFR